MLNCINEISDKIITLNSENNKLKKDFPSILIPFLPNNIKELTIRAIVRKLNLGTIKKIDIVKYRNSNNNLNKIFIHFNEWNIDKTTNAFRNKIIAGHNIIVVYNNPWFCKMKASIYNF